MSHKQANRWGDKWIHKPTHTKTDMHTYKEITILSEATIIVYFYFFFCSGMLINSIPDDCFMHIGFILIFNIMPTVNVIM